jgi:ABC-type multidrug transport system permease subunit
MRIRIAKRSLVCACVLLLLIVPLAACSSNESTNPKKDAVGTWQSADKTLTLDFAADGSLHAVSHATSGVSIEVTSTGSAFTDATHIYGTWEVNISTYEVHISGDTMVLKGTNGKQISLTRVK